MLALTCEISCILYIQSNSKRKINNMGNDNIIHNEEKSLYEQVYPIQIVFEIMPF